MGRRNNSMRNKDMESWRHIATLCRFGSLGFQSVCRATAANIGTFVLGQLVRRLEYVVCHGLQRGAGGVCGSPRRDSKITPRPSRRASMPNPSFKRTPGSVAHQPASAGPAAHFALAVRRATLPGSA